MKTKITLLTIIAAAVLFNACVGMNNLGAFDDTIPEAMQANLEIRNNLSVILYNDQPVSWSPGFTQNKVSITLPPGPSTFVVSWTETSTLAGMTFTDTRTYTLSKDLLPGHNYRITRSSWNFIIRFSRIRISEVR